MRDVKKGFSMYKAQKGVIKCTLEYDPDEKIILNIDITGDFFFYPEEALEELIKRLKGIYISRDEISRVVKSIYEEYNVSSPGVSIDDFVKVVYDAGVVDE